MKKLLALTLLAVGLSTGYSQSTNSGTLGGTNGWSQFLFSAINFLQPNPTNGIFEAEDFEVAAYGALKGDEIGGGIAAAYWFNNGIGSSLRLDYFENDVVFTEVSMVARTTFWSFSPYVSLGASHETSGGDREVQAAGSIGLSYGIPLDNIDSRVWLELSGRGEDEPTIRFGLTFAWGK